MQTLNIVEQSNAELKKNLANEKHARKSVNLALEGAQRQAEDQRKLMREANDQLACLRSNWQPLRNNWRKPKNSKIKQKKPNLRRRRQKPRLRKKKMRPSSMAMTSAWLRPRIPSR